MGTASPASTPLRQSSITDSESLLTVALADAARAQIPPEVSPLRDEEPPTGDASFNSLDRVSATSSSRASAGAVVVTEDDGDGLALKSEAAISKGESRPELRPAAILDETDAPAAVTPPRTA